MGFTRRLVETYNTSSIRIQHGNRVASNIRRIIVHHTGGWPHNTVNDLAASYHFLVETGLNQHATARVSGGRVSLMNQWNFNAPHAGTHNHDSLGISVAGNHHNQDSVVGTTRIPPTNMDRFPDVRAQVDRHLSQIIADCLISFPTIARTNRTGQARYVTASGIMGHTNVSNQPCPGVNLRHSNTINLAIHMANTFDAADRLSHRPLLGITGSGTTQQPNNPAGSAVQWARNANLLQHANGPNVGQFIIRLNDFTRFRTTQRPTRITNAADAIRHLSRPGVDIITVHSVDFWISNHSSVGNLGTLLINAANLID